MLDQLTLFVDKSLVIAEDMRARTRYRLLETVRQYALEKLGESGEAGELGGRHRDYYTAMAAELDAPAVAGHSGRLMQVEIEIDNLRSAFAWSLEAGDTQQALRLAASLQALWFTRWRLREGLGWLDAALDAAARPETESDPAWVRALADKAQTHAWLGTAEGAPIADKALLLAREMSDPALMIRALVAHGICYAYDVEVAGADFTKADRLARELDDRWRLSQVLTSQAMAGSMIGDPAAIIAAAPEGRDLADSIGDDFNARRCRSCLGVLDLYRGGDDTRRRTAPRVGRRSQGGARSVQLGGLRGERGLCAGVDGRCAGRSGRG